ncbi:MAG TPA: glycosyl hydrolase family 65 protein, partial [Acidimicrobiales bacterium]|nr:glycosyl hydrolase family 65 protein [Acidimicrobiales bacterium]
IGRLDLILEAEGDSVNRYKVGKQADALMLFYLFSADELRSVLDRMGYALDPEVIPRTVAYYTERVTHGSSLSPVVHAWVLARGDREASWRYFRQALEADLTDGRAGSGTTREGIHIGAMAGTIDILQRCYTGMEARGECLWLHPMLPAQIDRLGFKLFYRGHPLELSIDRRRVRVSAAGSRAAPATIVVNGEPCVLHAGKSVEAPLG